MKGYCVDVSGFCLGKKKLVAEGYKDLSKTQDEKESKVLFEKLKKENTDLLAEIDKLKGMVEKREKALFKSEKGAKFCLISLAILGILLLIL